MSFDKLKFNIGFETLLLVSKIEAITNDKKIDNPRELFKILDLVGHYHDSRISELQHILTMRKILFGKKFIRECCEYSIKISS